MRLRVGSSLVSVREFFLIAILIAHDLSSRLVVSRDCESSRVSMYVDLLPALARLDDLVRVAVPVLNNPALAIRAVVALACVLVAHLVYLLMYAFWLSRPCSPCHGCMLPPAYIKGLRFVGKLLGNWQTGGLRI
jgi:hypothetical protein